MSIEAPLSERFQSLDAEEDVDTQIIWLINLCVELAERLEALEKETNP